ncbi:MAG TPA: VC0807 family protein [Actinomycetales bacterium]|nr:VC0807 family protein [Actinomycetales bacterium]
MPSPRKLALDVGRHLGESVIGPLVIFYVVLVTAGLQAALIGALAWAYTVVAVHLLRRSRPPVLLLVTAALATLQAGVATAANSATVYFLQPTAATYLFAGAMLLTVPLKRPLIQRLAHDFCPLPDDVLASSPVRKLFQRLSLLWGSVLLVNASTTLALLLTTPPDQSMPVATAASVPVFVLALWASYRWFRRSIHDGGFVLRWGGTPAPVAATSTLA